VIVLDTHAWIWWNHDDRQLSAPAGRAIDRAETIYISAISCFEVATAVRRRRLVLDRDTMLWVREALALPRVALVPLSVEIAIEAAQLSKVHGDPGDRIIVATALHLGMPLVTKDRRLRRHAGLTSVW
jgi:PIN domain nuclease of toxin-antitoxin system